MNNYHIIGVLERADERQEIDQHLSAGNASDAIDSFEIDGWYWLSKVAVIRMPCVDKSAYSRQVALAREEMMTKPKKMPKKPKQMRMKI